MRIKFTNTEEFESVIQKFINFTNANPSAVAGKLAFDAYSGVTTRTPVDTGFARSQWQIAEGSPNLNVQSRDMFAGNDDGLGKAKAENLAKIEAAQGKFGKEFPTWYITNNVNYIIYLEQGHSKQMNKGYMVSRTINDLEMNLRNIVEEIEASDLE